MGWGIDFESLISARNDFIFILRAQAEESSKAKSIFLITFQSRLIWSVNIIHNITHNFNTWAKCVERSRGENHLGKISSRNLNWQAENELNARTARD